MAFKLISGLLLVTLLGCVTGPEVLELKRVKKVAIIGFGAVPEAGDHSLKYVDNPVPTAEAVYGLVARQLELQKHWQVLSLDEVRQHPAYRKVFRKFNSRGLRTGLQARDLLSGTEAVDLKRAVRQKLLAALHVDALVNLGFVLRQEEVEAAAPTPAADGASSPAKTPPARNVRALAFFDLFVKRRKDSIWHVASRPSLREDLLPASPSLALTSPEETAVATAIYRSLLTVLDPDHPLTPPPG